MERSNRLRIEDSNKDNYKQTLRAVWSQMYLLHTEVVLTSVLTILLSAICAQLGAGKPAGALCVHDYYSLSCCYKYCMHTWWCIRGLVSIFISITIITFGAPCALRTILTTHVLIFILMSLQSNSQRQFLLLVLMKCFAILAVVHGTSSFLVDMISILYLHSGQLQACLFSSTSSGKRNHGNKQPQQIGQMQCQRTC